MPEINDIPTFAELDMLCDMDPLELTKDDAKLRRLIVGMRAYRANALSKGGKATKFSEESGIKAADLTKLIRKDAAPKEKMRRV